MEMLDFVLKAGKLKKIKRTGWLNNNIPNPESVAEHSFRVAVLASLFAPKVGVDQLKAIQMALFHDMAESEVGDIVARKGAVLLSNYHEKIAKEKSLFQEYAVLLDKRELLDLFNEYTENKTPAAKLVKELDKLEMAIQAYEYESEYKVHLQTFFDTSHAAIHSKEIRGILQEIEKLRGKSSG